MWFAKGMDARITDGGAYGKGYERAMHFARAPANRRNGAGIETHGQ